MYGASPNSQVSPITLGHPGTLPMVNQKAIELATTMGIACNGTIQQENYFARKNYFYPDLPKGYQISQHTVPIISGGYLDVVVNEKTTRIRLNRIHLEEDAGKSIHDQHEDFTSIDLNRAGTPLIEIVTEPDIRSADEAAAFLTTIRQLLRYLGVCDGNMQEGSLRCDANISVRKKGDAVLGTKVEVKNLNSIKFLKKAIEFEADRLILKLEKGEVIKQQTRSFDANSFSTFAMRDKEDADDYRYFSDPDLSPIIITDEFIATIKAAMPLLPAARKEIFKTKYGLSEYDAQLLTDDILVANYFEEAVANGANFKMVANWMNGPVKATLNENGIELDQLTISPGQLGKLVGLVEKGLLSFSIASTKLWSALLKSPSTDPLKIAEELELLQNSDSTELEPIIFQILTDLDAKVQEYKKGKKGLLSLFVGEVMKRTKGKADPKLTNELLLDKLK
jgi:aspartyl-tRNA(Asn)/glutamyl-tRNA(Gln) amidotransferase subunit B